MASIGKIVNREMAPSAPLSTVPMEPLAMRKPKRQKKPLNDLSRSLTAFDPNETLIAVVEMSKMSWLVAAIIPGVSAPV
jgi:hypothetical protein